MKNYLKNSIVQLAAWHSFLLSVVVVSPLLLTLGSWGLMEWPAAAVLALACVHLGLICVQVSLTGEAVPKGWGAVWFFAVPPLYMYLIVMCYRLEAADWLLRSIVLLIHAAYVSVQIVRGAYERVKHYQCKTQLDFCGNRRTFAK